MTEHNDEFWTVYAKCKESRTRKYMNLVYLFKLIVLFSLESTVKKIKLTNELNCPD